MSILKKVKRCSRCGSILQTEDPTQSGYITPLILKKYPDGILLCDSCFNEVKQEKNEIILDNDFIKVLESIKKSNSLIIYVLDIFSFEGGFSSNVTELLSDLDVIAVANKVDLMPLKSEERQLKEYVSHRLRMAKLNVKDVILTSSNTNYNIDKLRDLIAETRNNRDVYFLGSQNSGKSSLISEIIKNFNNTTGRMIVTYTFPETSLRGFRIPTGTKNYIYEVPGFPINNSLINILDKPISNYIVPKKPVENRKITISEKVSLAIGGICFVELTDGEKTVLNCYFSPKIDVKTKRGDALKFFNSILKNGNQKNTCFKFRDLTNFDVYDFFVEEKGERDLGILGLGWMQFKGNSQTFRVYVPRGTYVFTTRAKLNNVK